MAKATDTMTVGQLARNAGVGIPTIRFYERRGLLADPRRTASGYRAYSTDCVRRVRFIRRAQELGFSLAEVADLLSLSVDPGKSCADVRARTTSKIADIDLRMARLARLRQVLQEFLQSCPGEGPTDACPILVAMDEGDERPS